MTVFPDVFTEIAVLMLGQSAGRMDFAAFRQAFLAAENREPMLGLLVCWLWHQNGSPRLSFLAGPVFVTAGAMLRPALVA